MEQLSAKQTASQQVAIMQGLDQLRKHIQPARDLVGVKRSCVLASFVDRIESCTRTRLQIRLDFQRLAPCRPSQKQFVCQSNALDCIARRLPGSHCTEWRWRLGTQHDNLPSHMLDYPTG
jgi:hypothetical protein